MGKKGKSAKQDSFTSRPSTSHSAPTPQLDEPRSTSSTSKHKPIALQDDAANVEVHRLREMVEKSRTELVRKRKAATKLEKELAIKKNSLTTLRSQLESRIGDASFPQAESQVKILLKIAQQNVKSLVKELDRLKLSYRDPEEKIQQLQEKIKEIKEETRRRKQTRYEEQEARDVQLAIRQAQYGAAVSAAQSTKPNVSESELRDLRFSFGWNPKDAERWEVIMPDCAHALMEAHTHGTVSARLARQAYQRAIPSAATRHAYYERVKALARLSKDYPAALLKEDLLMQGYLQQQVNEAQSLIQKHRERVAKAKRTVKIAQARIEQTTTQHNELEKEIKQIKSQLASIKSTSESYTSTIEHLRKENAALREEKSKLMKMASGVGRGGTEEE